MSAGTPVIRVEHLGGDRLRASVRGHQVYADQPVADGGEDSAPTPTELFLASLAGCVAFYAERFLRRHGVERGVAVSCEWEWAGPPAHVGRVRLTVDAPGLPPERAEAFRRVIENCPIHSTLRLHPEVTFEVVAEPAAGAA